MRRAELCAREPEVPADFFAAQRLAIYRQVERRRHLSARWLVPLFATLLLAVVIIIMFKPAPRRQAVNVVPDTQVFEDVFKIATSTEAAAVEPVRSLFEVQQ